MPATGRRRHFFSWDPPAWVVAIAPWATVLVAGACAYGLFAWSPPSMLQFATRHVELTAAVLLLIAGLGHAGVTGWLVRRLGAPPRRPVLLVIDDLDRCSAERVVKLLETVHTLLRDPNLPIRWANRRQPAPLLVLVIADGRWVRQAFEKVYADYAALGGDVHGLGADFVQKLFDHTVLIPTLSAGQAADNVDALTDSARHPGTSAAPTTHTVSGTNPAGVTAAGSVSVVRARAAVANATPHDVNSAQVDDVIDDVPDPAVRTGLRAQQAAKAAGPAATAVAVRHLVASHAELLPGNPRLIKRVANAWGMLRALKGHLEHHQPDAVLIRAAVLLVRFPALVDALLHDADPPDVNPATAPTESPWRRHDVQHVINGYTARDLAECYGRTYPPGLHRSSPTQPETEVDLRALPESTVALLAD